MTSQRWRIIEDVFQAAAGMEPKERSRYLDRICGRDRELRLEVESLLSHQEGGDRFLRDAVEDAASNLPRSRDSYIASRIGPYLVIRELGRGGMGTVYLAVRTDEHYLQTVAIKLVKSGMDSEELIRRLRHERQILANLAHPNIASILDGGSTDDGLPYIIMEHIEGQAVTEYCNNRDLGLRERLLLFCSVCRAVHYAHQKLVIHRDIKPGNILVTSDGIPKLLDFGLAKLLLPELGGPDTGNGGLPMTEPLSRMMTPDYASPEQVLGESITTASDVYSLGVVLFELLTGARPYSTAGLSFSGMQHVICEDPVSRPSEAAEIPRRIAKELRGDLENIVLMAMRKEPSRRYKSAEQLAEDISRYLDGMPVIARVDTPLYRAGKFLRRHRAVAAAVTALFITLLAGSITTAWESHKAGQRFAQLRALVESVILTLDEKLSNLPQSTEVRAALIQSTLEYLDELAKDPGMDRKLLIEVARAYQRVGQVQGSPFRANLGQEKQAVTSYEKSLAIAQQLARRSGNDPAVTNLLIDSHYTLAQLQNYAADSRNAEKNYEEALRLAKAFYQARPDDERRRRLLGAAYSGIADLQVDKHRLPEALAGYGAAIAILNDGSRRSESAERNLGEIYHRLGMALFQAGPLADALDAFQHAERIREKLVHDHPANLRYQRQLSVTKLTMGKLLGGAEYVSMGNPAAAISYFEQGRIISEKLARLDTKNVQAKTDLGFAYARTGEGESWLDPQAAIAWYRKSIAISRELMAEVPASVELRWEFATRSRLLAEALANTGQRREAAAAAREARDVFTSLIKQRPAKIHFRLEAMETHCLLFDLERRAGNREASLLDRDAALKLAEDLRQNRDDLYVAQALARCYDAFSREDSEHAMEWREKSHELWELLHKNGVAGFAPSSPR